jgi:hypothetical protein
MLATTLTSPSMADSLHRLADRTQDVGCFADNKQGGTAVACPHHYHLIRPDTLTPIYPKKKKRVYYTWEELSIQLNK